MNGIIKSIPDKNGKPTNWCFVKGEDGKEYFLHASELFNPWDTLKAELVVSKEVMVEFESTMGVKGPRAVGAQLIK